MAGQEYLLKTVLQLKDQMSAPMKEIRKRFSAFGRSMKDLNRASSDLAGMIGKPFAILGGASGFSIASAVSSYVELADSIDKAAIRAGVGAEALQKLRYAARNSGMASEDMDKALAKLTGEMAKAASGDNDKLAALFRHLGISLKDSQGRIRSASDVMRNLAQAVQANESPAARMQMLTAAFGDELAVKMIPLLKGGTAGLDAFSKRAEELGLVMSEADVAAANRFGDSLGELKELSKTVSVAIGAKLAPSIQSMIPQMQSVIVKCRDLIATNVQEFVEAFAKEMDKIDWERTIQGVFDCVRSITSFISAIGGVSTIAKAFGVLIGVNLVIKAASFVRALMGMATAVKMLGLAAAANPIGAVLTVVAGLALVLYNNWEPILSWFQDKLETVSKYLSKIFGGAGDAAKAAQNLPVPAVPGVVAGINQPGALPQQSVKSDSTVKLELSAADGTKAKVIDMRSTGDTKLAVDYQYSMMGAD